MSPWSEMIWIKGPLKSRLDSLPLSNAEGEREGGEGGGGTGNDTSSPWHVPNIWNMDEKIERMTNDVPSNNMV